MCVATRFCKSCLCAYIVSLSHDPMTSSWIHSIFVLEVLRSTCNGIHPQDITPHRSLSISATLPENITNNTCGIYLELGTPVQHFQIRSSHDHMLSLTAVEALTALSGIIPNKPRKKVHLQHGAVHQRKQVAEMYKYVHQIYGTAVYRPPGTKKA